MPHQVSEDHSASELWLPHSSNLPPATPNQKNSALTETSPRPTHALASLCCPGKRVDHYLEHRSFSVGISHAQLHFLFIFHIITSSPMVPEEDKGLWEDDKVQVPQPALKRNSHDDSSILEKAQRQLIGLWPKPSFPKGFLSLPAKHVYTFVYIYAYF